MSIKIGTDGKYRCFGNEPGQEIYAEYHDNEWGIPQHDEQKLFEFLILEGAQAGLSWYCVLKKRENYRAVYKQFVVKKVAQMSDKELDLLMDNPNIIRNRLKIYSARKNAKVFLNIQHEFGSFDRYIWGYVNNQPIINNFKSLAEMPTSTTISESIAKDLKIRGMSFVGATIMYAYMQAIGMVNDHVQSCCMRN